MYLLLAVTTLVFRRYALYLVPLTEKQVISETFFPASHLGYY